MLRKNRRERARDNVAKQRRTRRPPRCEQLLASKLRYRGSG
jgi:hypothetical protein